MFIFKYRTASHLFNIRILQSYHIIHSTVYHHSKNNCTVFFKYVRISFAPSFELPKRRSTKIMGTYSMLKPIRLARTMISIWKLQPLVVVTARSCYSTFLWIELILLFIQPKTASKIRAFSSKYELSDKIGRSAGEFPIEVPSLHPSFLYVPAAHYYISIRFRLFSSLRGRYSIMEGIYLGW